MATYTENEFKKVLKNLFMEKKRVKVLQKKMEQYHKQPLAGEYAALKSAYHLKEGESREYRAKLEKVQPILQKLVGEQKRLVEKLSESERAAYTQMRALSKQKAELVGQNARLLEELKEMKELVMHAQQHLAKKVKESTILRDLSERQAERIAQLEMDDKIF